MLADAAAIFADFRYATSLITTQLPITMMPLR